MTTLEDALGMPQLSEEEATLEDRKICEILRLAYLCAVGDADLADEELEDLFEIRGLVRDFLRARKGIEMFVETGDFSTADKICDMGNSVRIHDMNSFSLWGGLPPFLDELHEKRAAVQTEEELVLLYKVEADKIEDPFDQEVALVIMWFVADKDGEFSAGEQFVRDYFEKECWNLDPSRPNFLKYAMQIIKGEEEEELDEEAQENVDAAVQSLLDELMSGLEDPADSIRFDTKGGKKNLASQAAACLTICLAADGVMAAEEVQEMGSVLSRLVAFYDCDDGQTLMEEMNRAANAVLTDITGEKGYEDHTPPKNIKKLAKRASKNITDHTLASLICNFCVKIAGADGLDAAEEGVLELFMETWNVSDEDIEEAEELT